MPVFRKLVKSDENIDTGKKNRKLVLKKSSVDLDQIFENVLAEVREYVIGQENYTENLCKAFERPFLYDNEKTYANIAMIFGPAGCGRYYAIRAFTTIMAKEKLLKSADIYNLDFSKYTSDESIDDLFYPDLYKALYGKAEVVVINDFEKGCEKTLDCINSLVQYGTIKLDKRFCWSKGDLQEVSGSYSLDTMDSLNANNKYIFLISEKKQDVVLTRLPSNFTLEIMDVMTSCALTDECLVEIAQSFIADLQDKIKESTGIILHEQNIVENIVRNCDKSRGIEQIADLINKRLYNAIVNLILENSVDRNEEYVLEFKENALYLDSYFLTEIRRKIDEVLVANSKAKLNEIIGLNPVKEFFGKLEAQIRYSNKKDKKIEISRHMIFTGNPGTGKTTIARIMADFLKGLGCLSSGHMIESTRDDFVGQYIGETALKTKAVLKRAKGGILFIDEAYSLVRGSNDIFGLEAVDALVKYIEDNRDDLVVILAGYKKEMTDFMKANSGLTSRFNYTIEFPDYTSEELLEILNIMCNKKGFEIQQNYEIEMQRYLEEQKMQLEINFGNARFVRNMVEKAIINYASRTLEYDNVKNILTLEDFEVEKHEPKEKFDLDKTLKQIVGMQNVKEFIKTLQSYVQLNQLRKEMGLQVDETQTLHMVFAGNPGTGKTTMARIVSEMFYAMGVLKTNKLVETDRAGLVSGYVGQTALKTKDVINRAKGGVLFIDEAYSLITDNNNDFGKEAIEILLKEMDDNRDELIVILAGYTEDMKKFMNSNPGLLSRFPQFIEFEDYTSDELLEISKIILNSKGFCLEKSAERKMLEVFEKVRKTKNFGNGRFARNICEKAIRQLSVRLSQCNEFSPELLSTITADDIEKVL